MMVSPGIPQVEAPLKGWLHNFGVVRLFIGHYRRLAIEFEAKLVARSGWSLEVGRGRRQFAVVAWEHVVGDYRQRGSEKPAMIEMVAMRLHEKLTLSPSWADVFDDVMRRDTVRHLVQQDPGGQHLGVQ
jgi:hypothetical protein